MNTDRATLLGRTVVDVDLENGAPDLPVWLRDVLDRALTASGIRTTRVASDEAIASLRSLDLSEVEDKECPICYDPLEDPKKSSTEKEASVPGTNQRGKSNTNDNHACKFNDPSLFLPTDETGLYSRFPTRNLYTLREATLDQAFPGYRQASSESKPKDPKEETAHIPVKLPSCGHIFGKPCIVEWFKNHVSCPICRVEVDAKVNDPKATKLSHIRSNIFTNFNDTEVTVDHLVNHSTDVFNPYHRPFNASITPLTDSFMHQDWATPYGEGAPRVKSREPNLILPRRFPFPEGRFFDAMPVNSPPVTVTTASPNVEAQRATMEDTFDTQSEPSNSGSSTPNTRSGGPERRRTTGRTHPYVRPE